MTYDATCAIPQCGRGSHDASTQINLEIMNSWKYPPGMTALHIGLSVCIPEGRSVITLKRKMHRVRPIIQERVLGFEDNLENSY